MRICRNKNAKKVKNRNVLFMRRTVVPEAGFTKAVACTCVLIIALPFSAVTKNCFVHKNIRMKWKTFQHLHTSIRFHTWSVVVASVDGRRDVGELNSFAKTDNDNAPIATPTRKTPKTRARLKNVFSIDLSSGVFVATSSTFCPTLRCCASAMVLFSCNGYPRLPGISCKGNKAGSTKKKRRRFCRCLLQR